MKKVILIAAAAAFLSSGFAQAKDFGQTKGIGQTKLPSVGKAADTCIGVYINGVCVGVGWDPKQGIAAKGKFNPNLVNPKILDKGGLIQPTR